MKTRLALVLVASLLLSIPAFATTDDDANRAKFEKECAAMIAPDGPCGHVVKGGGGRRGCVSQEDVFAKATPACQAVIEEWRAMKKK
ncbi:MAG: hypothetical protein LBU39_08020 [Desulfobulbaceae bacterium]|jgi:hypothetical protein|nr:hypothetical protein [Desulfobulbaceae bacterium]